MRKSSKCSYKIGVNIKNKKKFLKPEEALKAADLLNSKENSIKKYIAYKCTKCYFFHIGRSNDDIKKTANTIFTPRTKITEPEVAEFNEINVDISTVSIKEKVKEMIPVIQKIVESHDDFDWKSDKRIL